MTNTTTTSIARINELSVLMAYPVAQIAQSVGITWADKMDEEDVLTVLDKAEIVYNRRTKLIHKIQQAGGTAHMKNTNKELNQILFDLEEKNMTKQPMTVEQVIATLMATGLTKEQATAAANAALAAPVETVVEHAAQAVYIEKAPVQAPPVVETPVAPAPVAEAPVEEPKVAGRPWFKRIMNRMMVSDKELMINHLSMEKYRATSEQDKNEIQDLINKLETQESFYVEKVEPFLIKTKGWAVDSTGKLADGLYLTGEYAGKGASGLTKVVGKGTQLVGKGIVIAGEAIEDAAPVVGKVVEAPFRFVGDTVNVINGTKEMPKPSKN